MDSSQNALGIGENKILLNPRWPQHEADSLREVAKTLSTQLLLKDHIWLATSGSTSQNIASNKLVALAESAFEVSARAVNAHLQVTTKDVWLQVLPRFHVGGLGIEVRARLSGSKVIQDFERWDPLRAVKLLETNNITLASMVPTQVFDLVRANLRSPKDLRAVVIGGGALTESLYKAGRQLGWPLLPSYGMTETCSQIATAGLDSLDQATMPYPKKLSHAEWKLNSEGRLQVHGLSLMSCYGQRQADGAIQGWDPKHDGWFTTEDYVKLHNAETEIEFLGRSNDFIKIGGEGSSMGRLRQIFDRVLMALPVDVSSSLALVDAPSKRLGSEIHLLHTPNIDQTLLLQIKETYNQEVLPFEKVRATRKVPEIPRSELGKILWAKLKKDLYGD